MAEVRVLFEWGGAEPEVRAAMDEMADRHVEDLTPEELAELFVDLSRILRRNIARSADEQRRRRPPGVGRLADEAVTRELRCHWQSPGGDPCR